MWIKNTLIGKIGIYTCDIFFVISVFSIFIVRKVIELILSSASFSKTEVKLSQE